MEITLIFAHLKPQEPIFSSSQIAWIHEQDITALLLISNFVFAVAIVLILFYRRNTVRYYENQIAKLEDKSRRSLMNPHFFFNALNGVQGLFITNGLKATNKYIGLLSNLLRFTLELNINNFISLEEEIEYIKNYVELMQFRLEQKFTFSFDYQTKKSLSYYSLPPMLIQPLVENAILHGLSPLQRSGHLYLTIMEKKDQLHILIKDNGIGVPASKQRQKMFQKKSYATQVLRERISIYNKLHKNNIFFFLNKDRSKTQILKGTEALVIIPTKIENEILTLNPFRK